MPLKLEPGAPAAANDLEIAISDWWDTITAEQKKSDVPWQKLHGVNADLMIRFRGGEIQIETRKRVEEMQ